MSDNIYNDVDSSSIYTIPCNKTEDIYLSAIPKKSQQNKVQDSLGGHNHRPFKLAVVFLGLLCVLLLAVNIGLCIKTEEARQLQRRYNNLTEEKGHLIIADFRRVHFYAAHPNEQYGFVKTIAFSDVILNEGSAFRSGVFTAPVNGIYQFFFSFQSGRDEDVNEWHLQVNGVAEVVCFSQVKSRSTVGSMCTYMAELKMYDKVTVSQVKGIAWASAGSDWTPNGSRTITFSGSLLMQKP